MKPYGESVKDVLVRSLNFQGSFSSKALNFLNTECEQQNIVSGEWGKGREENQGAWLDCY